MGETTLFGGAFDGQGEIANALYEAYGTSRELAAAPTWAMMLADLVRYMKAIPDAADTDYPGWCPSCLVWCDEFCAGQGLRQDSASRQASG